MTTAAGPLPILTSAILGSEATSAIRLAGDMVDALQLHNYLTGADCEDAWDAVHERILTLYGRVSDRELADAALAVLVDRQFLLDSPAA